MLLGAWQTATVFEDDLFWVIVGVVIAAVVGVITIWMMVRSRPSPRLAYDTQATPVVAPEAAGRLQIMFDGEPVDDVHLVDLTVANTGNTAFVEADFVRPLHLILPEGATALSVQVTDANPHDLGPSAEIDPQTGATVRVELLNPDDGFTVSVLVKGLGPDGDVYLGGRVAGVREFERSRASPTSMLAAAVARSALTATGISPAAGLVDAFVGQPRRR